MKAYVQRNMMKQSLDIMFGSNKAYLVFGKPEVKTQPEGHCIDEPSLELPAGCGQPLFDALWDNGFRPSTIQDADQAIDALKNHIGFAEEVAQTLLHANVMPQRIVVDPAVKIV